MKKRSLNQRDRFLKRAARLLHRDIDSDLRLETTARRLRLFHKAWNRQMFSSSQGLVRLKDDEEWEQTFPIIADIIRTKVANTFVPSRGKI